MQSPHLSLSINGQLIPNLYVSFRTRQALKPLLFTSLSNTSNATHARPMKMQHPGTTKPNHTPVKLNHARKNQGIISPSTRTLQQSSPVQSSPAHHRSIAIAHRIKPCMPINDILQPSSSLLTKQIWQPREHRNQQHRRRRDRRQIPLAHPTALGP